MIFNTPTGSASQMLSTKPGEGVRCIHTLSCNTHATPTVRIVVTYTLYYGAGAGSLDSNGSTLPRYNTAQTYGRLPTTSDMTLTMPPPPPKVPSSNVSSAPVVAVDTPVLFTRESMDTLRETKIPAGENKSRL